MRYRAFILASAFLLPSLAIANPHCALAQPASLTTQVAQAPSQPQLPSPLPAKPRGPLSGIPFVDHIAGAGATLIDLGKANGMHQIGARNKSQFMLFDVTPDGTAAVSGVPIELSLADLKQVAAGNFVDLGEFHGLEGYFVRSGPTFQVFYATPDGKQVIPGVLWDASGNDLTKTEIANIPGAVPTVEVNGPDGPQAAPAAALPMIQNATFGTLGNNPAKHLYMLIDPQCIYSIRAFQELKPFAEANQVEISVIPLTILDGEDGGASTKSALALLSDKPDQIVGAWESGSEGNLPATQAGDKLRTNMLIAQAIGLKATPTFVWRKQDGSEGQLVGVPENIESLINSIGG
jgi:thiol:disulfide interchange protein DsbG